MYARHVECTHRTRCWALLELPAAQLGAAERERMVTSEDGETGSRDHTRERPQRAGASRSFASSRIVHETVRGRLEDMQHSQSTVGRAARARSRLRRDPSAAELCGSASRLRAERATRQKEGGPAIVLRFVALDVAMVASRAAAVVSTSAGWSTSTVRDISSAKLCLAAKSGSQRILVGVGHGHFGGSRPGSRTLRDFDQSKRTWREHSLGQVRKQRLPLLGSQWLRRAPTDPNPLAAGGHKVWTDRDGGGAGRERGEERQHFARLGVSAWRTARSSSLGVGPRSSLSLVTFPPSSAVMRLGVRDQAS